MPPAHSADGDADAPRRGGLVLATLILGAAVANINLAVANVALPTIGKELGASQTALNLVAVGFTLGLAASVLYLGALADRYGRRLMLLLGLALSIPCAALAAWAPSIEVLIFARLLGGITAGMAFPTTLSIVTALFRGKRRTVAIALWSGCGGAASSIGPLVVGALLTRYWWGSAFLITIPLAATALVAALLVLPRHAGEATEPVDNLGGIISVVLIGSAVLGINFAPVPGSSTAAAILGAIAIAAVAAFVIREKRAKDPLFDLSVARRRIYWVAALAGMIVFGALMGSLFVGQQFLQNVLGYSPLRAGTAALPLAALMVLSSPLAARLLASRGARFTLAAGYLFVGIGFVVMLTWRQGVGYLPVGAAYALVGLGVGLAGAPASRSIMSAVPVRRAGMGSATTDLQRDLGGAVMQSILGALLALRYSRYFTDAFAHLPAQERARLGEDTAALIKSSFGSAAEVAKLHPGADAEKIMAGAERAFTAGSDMAIGAALAAVVLGLTLVLVFFPGKRREDEMEAEYARLDS